MPPDKFFEFALEMTKQLLTLSSGLLALSLVFLKDVARLPISRFARATLFAFWLMQVASICAGILHIGALTGAVTQSITTTPYPPNAEVLARFQILLFGGGLIAMLAFVGSALELWPGNVIPRVSSWVRNRFSDASEPAASTADAVGGEMLEHAADGRPADTAALEDAPGVAPVQSMISPKMNEEPDVATASDSLGDGLAENATGDSVVQEENRTRGAL